MQERARLGYSEWMSTTTAARRKVKEPATTGRGEATRKAILEAAEVVFAELGFTSARLEDVAAAVGIRRASLVYYFRGKQELYDQVEADIFAALQQRTDAGLAAAKDPWQRLFAVLDAWLDFWVSRPTGARIIQRISADITPRASNPVEFADTTLRTVEGVIAEGRTAGAFGDVRATYIIDLLGGGILHYVCNASEFGKGRAYSFDDPAEVERFRDMLRAAARAVLSRRREAVPRVRRAARG